MGAPKDRLDTPGNPARGQVQGSFSACRLKNEVPTKYSHLSKFPTCTSIDISSPSVSCDLRDPLPFYADEMASSGDDAEDQMMGAAVLALEGEGKVR